MKFSKKRRILTILISLFFILFFNLFKKDLTNYFHFLSNPIQKFLLEEGRKISVIFEIGKISEQNRFLLLENQDLKQKVIELELLKKENQALREALGLELEKEFGLEMAQITSGDISQDFIIVDKGSKNGLSKDQTVITSGKVLVGKIEEVFENFSKVVLISHRKNSFSAKVLNRDIAGIIKGRGNFEISLELLPREKEVQVGDLVVTGGPGNLFPKNLLVGEIKDTVKNDLSPFQKVEIKPAFNINSTDFVFIILNP